MPRQVEGFCRLCLNYGKLSFEHIPPKSAFNNDMRFLKTFNDHINGRNRTIFRKGLGEYSLCEECNNRTGGWYGHAFVQWAKQGFEWFDKVRGDKALELPYYIRPLNVLKQILSMILAMTPETSVDGHRDLRRFILNPNERYLPPEYRAFVYFAMEGQLRFASSMVMMDTNSGGSDYILGEVALPPFGYCVTEPVGGRRSLAESKGLHDITWFSQYRYNEWTTVHLRIPSRATHMPSPLDYRDGTDEEPW